MPKERTFQIKSLIDKRECARTFKLGSIITFKLIGKHFTTEILENSRFSLRKMKAEILKKINLNVSVGHCRNAKKRKKKLWVTLRGLWLNIIKDCGVMVKKSRGQIQVLL